MHYSLRQSVAPTDNWLTVADLKAQCRIDGTAEDTTTLPVYLLAAKEYIQEVLSLQIEPATWVMTLDHFPSCEIEIPIWPVLDVDSLEFAYLLNGVSTPVEATFYTVDIQGRFPRIALNQGYSWPTPDTRIANTTITIEAGYPTANDVPKLIKQCVYLLAADWYESREDTAEKHMIRIPNGIDRIINLLKKRWAV
jgi:uncharacterized phiE125 gp8 family phage protein